MDFIRSLEPFVPEIILACAALSLVLYLVLDGFDLGVGVLSLFERDGEKREEMMESIATVWDGNESWLVMLGAVLFAGFPVAFGVVLPALYIPLFLMLVFLTFRGIAFEFAAQHGEHSRLWSLSFSLGSLGTAFTQGVALGAVLEGFAYSGGDFVGGTFDFLSPLSLAMGLFVTAMYTLSGAGWLVYKSRGDLLASVRRKGRLVVPACLALGALSVGLAFAYSPAAEGFLAGGLTAQAALVVGAFALAALAVVGAFFALAGPDNSVSLWLASAGIVCVAGGFLALVYPYVVLPGITAAEAAAPTSAAWLLLVAIVPLIPITVAYNAVAYYLFRGKTHAGEVGHGGSATNETGG